MLQQVRHSFNTHTCTCEMVSQKYRYKFGNKLHKHKPFVAIIL